MIRVCAGPEELSTAAAELFAAEAARAVARQGRFSVLLAGGETPRRCYELLAQAPLCDRVPWERVHVFWGDERCVPAADPRSNAGMARRALLDRVPVPPEQVHAILCDRSPREAAQAYAADLRGFFAGPPRFDLALLGLGADGHTLSLFPGALPPDAGEQRVVVAHRPGEDMDRVTLTAPVVNAAACVVFLVAGGTKAAVLRELLEGAPDPQRLPARLIRPVGGRLLWLIDREAAGRLEGRGEVGA
jgi:6-phosphogluconolactonase